MYAIAENCNVYGTDDVLGDLKQVLSEYDGQHVFLLTDDTCEEMCLQLVEEAAKFKKIIVISQGDQNKDHWSAMKIWESLSEGGATRKSALVNLGGGMICDIGGFAASCFKRGIDFINIPTTVLAQVDASLGGKTGMNLGGLKNEIGLFSMAKKVLVSGQFLKTLSREEALSGFAEMLKHALIHDAAIIDDLLKIDWNGWPEFGLEPDDEVGDKPDAWTADNYAALSRHIAHSITIKNHFATADPQEQGLRKALNFGHTFGHAFETYALRQDRHLPHGYAVAFGMVCELQLSIMKLGLDATKAAEIQKRIKELYADYRPETADKAALLELMGHDKKNDTASSINFSLLPELGKVEVNHTATKEEIEEALKVLEY